MFLILTFHEAARTSKIDVARVDEVRREVLQNKLNND